MYLMIFLGTIIIFINTKKKNAYGAPCTYNLHTIIIILVLRVITNYNNIKII